MPEKVFLDLAAALHEGGDLQGEGFFWPTSPHDYNRLTEDLNEACKDIIKAYEGSRLLSVLLGVGVMLPWEIGQVLIALKNLRIIRDAGLKPVASEESILYRPLLEDTSLPGPLLFGRQPFSRAWWKRSLTRPANFLFSLKYNFAVGKTNRWFGDHREGRVMALYRPGPLGERFMGSLKEWVDLRLIATWFGRSGRPVLPEKTKQGIEKLAEEVVSRFIEVGFANDVLVGRPMQNYLKSLTITMLSRTARDLVLVRDALKSDTVTHYLGVSGANYYSKIVGLVVREMGGMVTAFSHGYDTCRYLRDYSVYEFSACDHFVVGQSSHVPLFQRTLDFFPPPLKNPVKLVSVNDDSLVPTWKRYRRQPATTHIRRVMVMGGFFRGEHVKWNKLPDLTMLDLELRIIDLLVKAGYEVLYKGHPEGLLMVKQYYRFPANVRVIVEPFEQVMDEADAFIFHLTVTTTIGPALCTNKPIIYINGGWEPWFEDCLEKFGKRATIVSGKLDEKNRALFDEAALLEALEKKTMKLDEAFMKTYLLPETNTYS